MGKLLANLIALLCFASSAIADNGLISVKSLHDVTITADRFEKQLNQKGMTVFARIDHAKNAHKVGQTLRPTQLIIFGNPKVGTGLMRCGQSVAIDLPQKALIREDEAGQVWVIYNAPQYLAKRHGIGGCDDLIKKIANALGHFAEAATSR